MKRLTCYTYIFYDLKDQMKHRLLMEKQEKKALKKKLTKEKMLSSKEPAQEEVSKSKRVLPILRFGFHFLLILLY
jgi:hypothetical protein